MKLTHVTHKRNLKPIDRLGLLAAMATGKRKACWFVPRHREEWAMMHVALRHGYKLSDLVSIEVDVPDEWLRPHSDGTYYSYNDIPPCRLGKVCRLVKETVNQE